VIDLTPWTGTRAEMWPRLRLAIQTTIAACLAYVIADALGLPQGFWAVMTAILVTQANVGASLGLAAERLGGSLLGVIVGGGVAVALADAQELKFAGLAVTVLILGFFSARRPSLRIACVTAAIVVLGDPRLGPPIASAENRMIEVVVGTVVAILTSLVVFPSRAGPSFAEHVTRTFTPLFEVARDTLSAAMGQPLDVEAMGAQGTRIRAAFAEGDTLAREARLEVAGYLADSPDPEAILRALRRLWHTEIMLLRAVAQPLPEKAVQILGPQIETLRAAIDDVAKQLASPTTAYVAPNLAEVESALAAIEHRMEEMRARGETRDLSMDDIIRLMAFDFALGQLRLNLRDIAERTPELAAFAGSTFPFLRRLHAMLHGLRR
jgi:uncharacterized membrane protein YccC